MEVDTVINAAGRDPVIPENLIHELEEMGKKVYLIGKAKTGRKLSELIHEGFIVGIEI